MEFFQLSEIIHISANIHLRNLKLASGGRRDGEKQREKISPAIILVLQ